MQAKINQISIITNNFDSMVIFYKNVLGFQIKIQMDNYVEFINDGVRFAIATSSIMYEITRHKSFQEGKKGQTLELAFEADTPSEVDEKYKKLVQSGAKAVASPEDMPWGHRAAFFADPDGNIHEIFAKLEVVD